MADHPDLAGKIDEVWMPEWIDRGIEEFVSLLVRHARFDAWCLEHGRKEDGPSEAGPVS